MSEAPAIREIIDADVGAVIALWHRAGVARPWNDPGKDIAFARKEPHSTILVACDGDEPVATAMVGHDGHRGWVYYVAVTPERQRQGLGAVMMQAAESWLREHGIWKVQLLVRADNAQAGHFYERLGYRDTRTVCFQKIIGD